MKQLKTLSVGALLSLSMLLLSGCAERVVVGPAPGPYYYHHHDGYWHRHYVHPYYPEHRYPYGGHCWGNQRGRLC